MQNWIISLAVKKSNKEKVTAKMAYEQARAEAEEYNEQHSHGPKCQHCGYPELVSAYVGQDSQINGLFVCGHSRAERFYKCAKCGNMQREDGSVWKGSFEVLREKGIELFWRTVEKDGKKIEEYYYQYEWMYALDMLTEVGGALLVIGGLIFGLFKLIGL